MASAMESIANAIKCFETGCSDPGLTVKESYTTDSVGRQTGLKAVHKLLGTGKCGSLLRWQLDGQACGVPSTKTRPERSDTEVYCMFMSRDDNLDVKRGICHRDVFSGRGWDEIIAKEM
eukprot:jgi/Undpi1/13578/HiC_scaffold_8.g03236.m1